MVLQDVIFTQSLFIIVYSGIYISKSSFVATYPSTNGSRIKTFPNTAAGVRKFIGALAVAEHHYVMEATGNYGFLLHHKQREAHESEILHDDAPADEPQYNMKRVRRNHVVRCSRLPAAVTTSPARRT